MDFGLPPTDLAHLRATLARFSDVERAFVFGSRAMAREKPGSDIDVAIETAAKANDPWLAARIAHALNEEGPLPYFVDVVDLGALAGEENRELVEHVRRVGVVLYERTG